MSLPPQKKRKKLKVVYLPKPHLTIVEVFNVLAIPKVDSSWLVNYALVTNLSERFSLFYHNERMKSAPSNAFPMIYLFNTTICLFN